MTRVLIRACFLSCSSIVLFLRAAVFSCKVIRCGEQAEPLAHGEAGPATRSLNGCMAAPGLLGTLCLSILTCAVILKK